MYDAVVVYDGNSQYQDKITKIFKKVDDIKAVEWEDESIQEFLSKQFGWKPKALIVVDDGTVYVGDNATEHLSSRQGIPSVIPSLVKSRLPFSTVLSKLLSFADDSDEIHGKFPLDEDAQQQIEEIRSGTDIGIN